MNKKTNLNSGFFYATKQCSCPYIKNKIEQKIVAEIKGEFANEIYSMLTKSGFRRSHNYCYAPICQNCSACISVRVCALSFVETKSFKRIINNNKDLSVRIAEPVATDENFDLFARYQNTRHSDSEMSQMNFDDFKEMLETTSVESFLMEVRDSNQKLVATALCDYLDDGFSAVYSFYDPNLTNKGLGNYMILKLIDEAKNNNLPYVYLGYWIEKSPKMKYKSRFKPIEALTNNGWKLI